MKIKIYACGGPGINIVSGIPGLGTDKAHESAERYYIDTSDANLRQNGISLSDKNVFKLDGVNGSGGVMGENKSAIADSIGDILSRFEPGELNIVVTAASGGSGSAFAAYLVKALLERDEAVILMLVGSFESNLRIKNTIAMVKSLNGICKVVDKPLLFTYRQNVRPDDADVDDNIRSDIKSLCLLYSSGLTTIDTKDRYHFVRFEKVCEKDHVAPMPHLLHIYAGDDSAMFEDIKQPIAVASVYSKNVRPEHLQFDIMPSYTTHGIMQDSKLSVPSLHYIVSRDVLDSIVGKLVKSQEDANKNIAARQRKPIMDSGNTDSEGMAF